METAVDGAERAGGRFETPEEYVGYEILDPEGRKIGRAKEVFTNAHGEPEYVRVRIGLLGMRSVLIPVGFLGCRVSTSRPANAGVSLDIGNSYCSFRVRHSLSTIKKEGDISDIGRVARGIRSLDLTTLLWRMKWADRSR